MVLEMLAGGGLLAAGWLVGRFAPARSWTPKPPQPPQAICGCEHALAFHDPATGQCHAMVEIPTELGDWNEVVEWENEQCTCRQYTGPTPLPTIYAPEVTS